MSGMTLGSTPYFFISHAVRSDRSVERFHADLQEALYQRKGHEWRYTGILADWRDTTAELRTPATHCSALVVLLSARYADSARCRLDRTIFEHRLRWQLDGTGSAPEVVRVVWDRTGTGPEQEPADERLTGPHYRRWGLARLVGDEAVREEYFGVVASVADRVMSGARQAPPVMTPQDSDYFDPAGAAGPLSATLFDWYSPDRQVAWHGQPVASAPELVPQGQQGAYTRAVSWSSRPVDGLFPIFRGPHR